MDRGQDHHGRSRGTTSIAGKLVVLLVLGFVLAATAILGASTWRLVRIIDNEQAEIFQDKLATLADAMDHTLGELRDTGMEEAYRDEAQAELLAHFRRTYYEANSPDGASTTRRSYPFILDTGGRVVLHPTLARGDDSLQDMPVVEMMLGSDRGAQTYRYQGQRKWVVYRRYEPWQWVLGYTMPVSVKYAEVRQWLWTIVPITVCLIGLIAWAVAAYLVRIISEPVEKTVTVLQEVAAGDLRQSLETSRRDEMGRLARHVNDMLGNLKSIIGEVQHVAQSIETSGREIVQTSESQAHGVENQSQAVSQTASAAAELAKTSETIGQRIATIVEITQHVSNGMEAIKQSTDQTSQILAALEEKSKQISHITDLINDVADQTNLLAVNASIEAARAGEQGRGFTVVADHIGKLADSTAQSTKDITALVELIQHDMSNALVTMQRSIEAIQDEIERSRTSAKMSKEIALSTSQQVTAAQQITEAMAGIDAMMKSIAGEAQQSSQAAHNLSLLARTLNDAVARFKV